MSKDLERLRAAWRQARKTKLGREVTDELTPFVKAFGISQFVYVEFEFSQSTGQQDGYDPYAKATEPEKGD